MASADRRAPRSPNKAPVQGRAHGGDRCSERFDLRSYVVSYFCKNAATEPCPDRAYVHADALDSFVSEWFTKALRSAPKLIDVVAQARDLEDAQREEKDAERQLNVYVEETHIDDPVLFQRGVDARRKRFNGARARVRELSARVTRTPQGGTLLNLWRGFTPSERRDVLGGFLDRVGVRRGASADLTAHVQIVWTDGTLAVPEVADDEARVRVASA